MRIAQGMQRDPDGDRHVERVDSVADWDPDAVVGRRFDGGAQAGAFGSDEKGRAPGARPP